MLAAFAASLTVLSVSDIALADDPPCSAGCEFLVKDFAGRYPDDAERAAGKWQCWDKKAKLSIACTFIRGKDIEKFSHVYRKGGGAGEPLRYQGRLPSSYSQCTYYCALAGRSENVCAPECRTQFPQ